MLSYLGKHLLEISAAQKVKTKQNNIDMYERYIAMYNITKEFIKEKGLLLYGGLAVNLSLPLKHQFYDVYELPDYDCFSYDAYNHARELAAIYREQGYEYVVVKPGVHAGTHKVYVDFRPVADITHISRTLFDVMSDMSIDEKPLVTKMHPGIDMNIAPLSFLRMSFHLELSRPNGNIERWPKVYRRMAIFYSIYPLQTSPDYNTKDVMIQDPMPRMNHIIENTLAFVKRHGYPIFGTEGVKIYLHHHLRRKTMDTTLIFDERMPRVDIFAEKYEYVAVTLQKHLKHTLFQDETLVIVHHQSLHHNEIVPKHAMLSLVKNGITRHVAAVFDVNACYAYKVVEGIRVLTIDAMLTMIFALSFLQRDYVVRDRLSCIANMLLNMQYKHISSSKYIWKRFDLACYGVQPSLEDIKRKQYEHTKKLGQP